MKAAELLRRTFDCECGRSHIVPTKNILYASDAVERLDSVLGHLVKGRRAVIIADSRTLPVAGSDAKQSLERAGWTVEVIIVPDTAHGNPVCDDITFNQLKGRFPAVDIALAVGSGVINDLAKWLAFEKKIPYAVLATAASMNGFTSANVAPAIDGVKTLLVANAPLAVFASPAIIADAPFELTSAGLGDVIAKSVSNADWLMNHIYLGEYFCGFCSKMMNSLEDYLFDCPQDIGKRRPQAIEALFDALLVSGMAMTIVGTSAPASGGEHLLSHTLDMMAGVDGLGHDLHGRQVGVGTIFACALYERIFRIDKPRCVDMPSDIDASFWGRLSGSVAAQYSQKKPQVAVLREKLNDKKLWQNFLDSASGQVRPPQQIKNCLKAAGAAHTFSELKCSRQRFRDAILRMHQIRKRPTVVDLAWLLGILPAAVDEIIDEWLSE